MAEPPNSDITFRSFSSSDENAFDMNTEITSTETYTSFWVTM